MKVAVLSGKGGTGKTLTAVNLTALCGRAVYVDCDAEAPNGELFFRAPVVKKLAVEVPLPQIDLQKCTNCRACTKFCRFNALVYTKNGIMLFAEQCHACGGCTLVCPVQAISEVTKKVGSIEIGRLGESSTITGKLKIGEPSSGPILKRINELLATSEAPVFIDCPPGADCSVMESVDAADFCLLVAEPTIFGLHNLQMVVQLLRVLKKPFAVLVNKAEAEKRLIDDYCQAEQIALVGHIPFSKELARINGNSELAITKTAYREIFTTIYHELERQVQANA